jgi:hypothetical protein
MIKTETKLSAQQVVEYINAGALEGSLVEIKNLPPEKQLIHYSLHRFYSAYPSLLKNPVNYSFLMGIWVEILKENNVYEPDEIDRYKIYSFTKKVIDGITPYILMYGRKAKTLETKVPYIYDYLLQRKWEKRDELMKWIREKHPEVFKDEEIQNFKNTE